MSVEASGVGFFLDQGRTPSLVPWWCPRIQASRGGSGSMGRVDDDDDDDDDDGIFDVWSVFISGH